MSGKILSKLSALLWCDPLTGEEMLNFKAYKA